MKTTLLLLLLVSNAYAQTPSTHVEASGTATPPGVFAPITEVESLESSLEYRRQAAFKTIEAAILTQRASPKAKQYYSGIFHDALKVVFRVIPNGTSQYAQHCGVNAIDGQWFIPSVRGLFKDNPKAEAHGICQEKAKEASDFITSYVIHVAYVDRAKAWSEQDRLDKNTECGALKMYMSIMNHTGNGLEPGKTIISGECRVKSEYKIN